MGSINLVRFPHPSSCCDSLLGATSDYFCLDGKIAEVVESIDPVTKCYSVRQIDKTASMSMIITACKIISYITIVLPLIVFAAHLILKSMYDFSLVTTDSPRDNVNPVETETVEDDGFSVEAESDSDPVEDDSLSVRMSVSDGELLNGVKKSSDPARKVLSGENFVDALKKAELQGVDAMLHLIESVELSAQDHDEMLKQLEGDGVAPEVIGQISNDAAKVALRWFIGYGHVDAVKKVLEKIDLSTVIKASDLLVLVAGRLEGEVLTSLLERVDYNTMSDLSFAIRKAMTIYLIISPSVPNSDQQQKDRIALKKSGCLDVLTILFKKLKIGATCPFLYRDELARVTDKPSRVVGELSIGDLGWMVVETLDLDIIQLTFEKIKELADDDDDYNQVVDNAIMRAEERILRVEQRFRKMQERGHMVEERDRMALEDSYREVIALLQTLRAE
ncbi:MAG: hypothetical protein HY860_04345 [Chlamydiales bacterium]|nr:hypothetical protein [Chlamydiales bacterium]